MEALKLQAILGLDKSKFDSGLDSASGKMGSFGSAIGSGFAKIAKAGAAALAASTAAVGAFAKASVGVGMEFDSSMSQVVATMGYSVDELNTEGSEAQKTMQTLRDFARDMGATTAFSAIEAADALNYMALAGYDAETSMGMLPTVLNLAAAGSFDLARASDMVTDTQTAFGLSLERTALMVDEMAKAASTGNTSVEQLGDAFLTVGGLAQELNGGFVDLGNGVYGPVDGTQELTIALTAMANAGIKGSEAGTHMRNMLLKLSSPTSDGVEQLEALGVAVFDDAGEMRSLSDVMGDLSNELGNLTQEERIQAISDLFNTRDMASAKALLGAVTGEFVKIGDEIYTVDEAYQKWGDDIYDSSKGFEYVRTSWDEIGAAVLDAAISLEDVESAVSNSGAAWDKYGESVTGNMSQLSENIRHYMTTMGMDAESTAERIAFEWGISMEDASLATSSVATALEEVEDAAQAMANVQLDNLAGDITIFKSALSDAQIELSDQLTPTLREFVQLGTTGLNDIVAGFKEGGLAGAMDALGELLQKGLAMILEGLPQWVEAGMSLLGAIGQGLLDNLPVIIEAAVTMLDTFIEGMVSALPAIIDGAIQIIGALGAALIDNIPLLIDAALEMVLGLANAIVDGLPRLSEKAPDIIHSLTDGLIKAIPQLMEVAVDLILALVEALTEPNMLYALVDAALEITLALMNGLIDAIPRLLDAVPQIISNLVTAIVASLPKIIAAGLELLNGLITAIVRITPRLVAQIPALILALVGGITRGIVKIVEVGKDIVKGLWEGIKERWKKLVEDFKGLAEGIVSGIKGLFGIHSPSKVFAGIGKNIDEGLSKGILDNMDVVDDAMGLLEDYTTGNVDVNASVKGSGAVGGGNNITMNIYGAQGQDVRELADIIIERIGFVQRREEAVYA